MYESPSNNKNYFNKPIRRKNRRMVARNKLKNFRKRKIKEMEQNEEFICTIK